MLTSALPATFESAAFIDTKEALHVAVKILIIILTCLVLRYLVHRAIDKLTERTAKGEAPVMLRPLRRAQRVVDRVAGLTDERRLQRAQTIGSVLKSVTSITIVGIGLVMVLGELDIAIGPIIASAGIVGVALGFGAQNLVKDFLNGIFMTLEDQYGVGDIVDLGLATGVIEAVGLRTTRLRDGEGVVWYVRNGEVLRVGNKSQGTASVIVDLPVAHGSDLDQAQHLLREAGAAMHADPAWAEALVVDPQVLGVESVTPTGITIRVVLTTTPADRDLVAREARQRFATVLEQAGIQAPTLPYGAAGEGRSA